MKLIVETTDKATDSTKQGLKQYADALYGTNQNKAGEITIIFEA